MQSTTFTQLMNSLNNVNDKKRGATIPDSWLQGRTAYGGLSAALCLKAVELDYPELPPLRSAQINFLGPTNGEVNVDTKLLRQGKSVSFISAELISTKGLATTATFCFGRARESSLNRDLITADNIPDINDTIKFKGSETPRFLENFDSLFAKGELPFSKSEKSEQYFWARHRDPKAQGAVALLALADVPPPALFAMLAKPPKISSMTWMLNFTNSEIKTEDGWWQIRCTTEHVREGYSSQDMTLWNKTGDLVISSRQNVAYFE